MGTILKGLNGFYRQCIARYLLIAGSIIMLSYRVGTAQDIVINSVELNNGNVLLHYTLNDDNPEHEYTLRLYSSKDNFVQPLNMVSGDIGVAVPVGGNKQVIWDARNELDSGFDGSVALQIKGQIYVPFIALSGFEDYGTLKRGTPYDLTWSGGRGDNVLNFELYRRDVKIWTQPNVANSGNLTMVIPTNVKPGKNYYFKIVDAHNPDEVIYSSTFILKRKIPEGLKIGATALVAGGLALLFNSILNPPTVPNLPDPPVQTR